MLVSCIKRMIRCLSLMSLFICKNSYVSKDKLSISVNELSVYDDKLSVSSDKPSAYSNNYCKKNFTAHSQSQCADK